MKKQQSPMTKKYTPVMRLLSPLLATLALLSWLSGCQCQEDVPESTFKAVHGDIYRAMTISDRSQLYDALAKIFTKDHLEAQFNRVARFQDTRVKDGVEIFIDDIEYQDLAVSGHSVKAHWIVRGSIQHNNHVHHRSLEYEADYQMVKEGGSWKVAGSEVVEHTDFELSDEERELGQNLD